MLRFSKYFLAARPKDIKSHLSYKDVNISKKNTAKEKPKLKFSSKNVSFKAESNPESPCSRKVQALRDTLKNQAILENKQ